MVTFGDVHQQMSGKNSNWLSDIKQCKRYKGAGFIFNITWARVNQN